MNVIEVTQKLIAHKRVYAIRQDWTAKRCRKFREDHGVSLRECARRMGVSASFLSDLELGRRNWNARIICNMVKAVLKEE